MSGSAADDGASEGAGVPEETELAALLDAARGARSRSYSPYSGFSVGAALLADDGRVFTGANIENAAYSPTMCAERVALGAAVMAGARAFRAVAVQGPGDGATTPCGVCRQTLYEFAPDLLVLAGTTPGESERFSLGTDLLPRAFGPRDLG